MTGAVEKLRQLRELAGTKPKIPIKKLTEILKSKTKKDLIKQPFKKV